MRRRVLALALIAAVPVIVVPLLAGLTAMSVPAQADGTQVSGG